MIMIQIMRKKLKLWYDYNYYLLSQLFDKVKINRQKSQNNDILCNNYDIEGHDYEILSNDYKSKFKSYL